jgi:hypothetical protein
MLFAGLSWAQASCCSIFTQTSSPDSNQEPDPFLWVMGWRGEEGR